MMTARQFAARLVGRHTRTQPWTPAAPSVLLRTGAARAGGGAAGAVTHHHHATVSPHITLTLHNYPHTISHPGITRAVPVREAHALRWVDQVSTRHYRRDPDPLNPSRPVPAMAAHQLIPFVPPLPRVLRHTVAEETAQPRQQQRPPPAPPSAPAPIPKTVTVTPVEVNRITDQVMRTLDRRLAAFRERHGRS